MWWKQQQVSGEVVLPSNPQPGSWRRLTVRQPAGMRPGHGESGGGRLAGGERIILTVLRKSRVICALFPEPGACTADQRWAGWQLYETDHGLGPFSNRTLARWTYHPYFKRYATSKVLNCEIFKSLNISRCIPFYFTGCGGNDNNFLSKARGSAKGEDPYCQHS